jgi:hypothetical protein
MRFIGVCIAGLALANAAWAESNVMTGAASANIGGDFRASWSHMDNGLDKRDGGDTPDASDTIDVKEADLHLHGKIDAKTMYKFEFSLLNSDYNSKNAGAIAGGTATARDILKQAYATHELGPVSWTLGRQFVHQGGWDFTRETHSAHAWGKYAGALPYSRYADGLAFNVKAGGDISLQLLNDVTTADGGTWNNRKHPTFVLAYHGSFGPVEPLFHYGTLDNQKSSWMDLGVKTSMNGLNATLDYHTVKWGVKTADGADKWKSEDQVSTAITLNVGYEIKGTATPYLYISTYDMKQSPEDSKVNADDSFADNGFTWSIGADIDAVGGANYKPFFTITSNSGKYNDSKGEEETRSEMNIELGAWGNI